MLMYIAAAVAVLIIAAINAAEERNDIKAMSLKITAGISLAVSILVVPYYKLSYTDPLIVGIKSFRYGVGTIGMNIDPTIIDSFDLPEPESTAYRVLLYLLYLAGPVFASLFAISFSRNLSELIRFIGRKKVHIFSELNSRTIAIAESIAASHPDELLVFCNEDPSETEGIKTRARAIHAVMTKRGVSEFPMKKNKQYELYQISSDISASLEDTAELCSKLIKKKGYDPSNVFVRFSASRNLQELVRDLDATYGDKVRLRPIDEYESDALSLLRNYCELLAMPGHKDVVLIGGGDTADAILGASLGILSGPESTFTVYYISKDADKTAARLKASSPEILPLPLENYFENSGDGKEYDIRFFRTDTDGSGLDTALTSIGMPELICITGGDDEKNFCLSQRIKRLFASRSDDLSYPPMACLIRDKKLNEILKGGDGVLFFGNEADRYDYEKVVDPDLEEEARRVHLSYLLPGNPNAMDLTGDAREKLLEESGFYSYVNMQSSMASALALEYRRAYILSKKPENTGLSDEAFIDGYLSNQDLLAALGNAEHRRWNAYQRLQGWRHANETQTAVIAAASKGRRIRSDEFLLHPALVPVEKLAETEESTDRIKLAADPQGRPTGFIWSDRVILSNLQKIITKKA